MEGCPFHKQPPQQETPAPATSPTVKLPASSLPVTQAPLGEFADDPVACMRRLYNEHGPIAALEEDGRRVYFIFDPEYNKQVLADSKRFHSQFFAVRGPKRSAHRRISSGLLSMNGAQHKEHRRLIMEPFQKRSILGYFDDVKKTTDELMAQWDAACRPNPNLLSLHGGALPTHGAPSTPGSSFSPARDINADMTAYMLRLTCSILFGLDNPELAYRVGEVTDRWVRLNHTIGPAAFAPNKDLTDRYDELLEAAEEMEAALKEMIAVKRAAGPASTEGQRDVLSLLLEAYGCRRHG